MTDVVYCQSISSDMALYVVLSVLVVLVLVTVVVMCIYRRRTIKKQKQERKQIMCKLDELENKTRETARNGRKLFLIRCGMCFDLKISTKTV